MSIRLAAPAPVAQTVQVSECSLVDYDASGTVLSVEFLYVSDGIDLRDVPHADEIEAALSRYPEFTVIPPRR